MRSSLWLGSAAILVACSGDPVGGTGPNGAGAWPDGGAGVPGAGGATAAGGVPGGVPGAGGMPGVQQGMNPAVVVVPGADGGVGVGNNNVDPILIDKCVAGSGGAPDKATVDQLVAGGGGGGRMLYPYEGTVFPRGMKAPLLMWEGAPGASAVYVRIKAGKFEYKFCGAPTADGQYQIPQDVWDAAGKKTRGKPDPFQIEVSALSNGKVVGPLKSQWVIAQATIKGSVYYNSYTSIKGITSGVLGGVVLRIPPGGEAETFVGNECNGCHSVSANGQRLVTQTLLLGARSLDITPAKPMQRSAPARAAYVAMYPDGTKYVKPSIAVEVARATLTAGLATADLGAALVETDTSNPIPAPNLPVGALMPSFSPDGRMLVFTDADKGARAIAAVDFDGKSNTSSNYRLLFDDTSGSTRAGWPFALPDDQAVVFVRGGGDWSGNGAGLGGGLTAILGPYSELFMVDVDTKQTTLMAKAMGFATAADAASKKTYLPFGNDDIGRAYFPTISPVAAGGYFWVFFDALRHYGNMGMQRQLWGTAVEISPNGDYSIDRSNPAFYLPGQEFGTGNHRAFTALDACKMDSDTCTSGTDCCGGFCTLPPVSEFGEQVGKCASTAQCARTDERCTKNEDCCRIEGQTPNTCINGFCAQLPILL